MKIFSFIFSTLCFQTLAQSQAIIDRCGDDFRLSKLNGSNPNSSNFNGYIGAYDGCADLCQLRFWDGPMAVTSKTFYPPDWQLVLEEEFNEPLDEGLWRNYLPWGNFTPTDIFCSECVYEPSQNQIVSGSLIQKTSYAPNQYLQVDGNGNIINTLYAHTKAPTISSRIMVPINSWVQARIKLPDVGNHFWAGFWLFGPDVEIDFFEIGNSSESSNNNIAANRTINMTYHRKKYGSIPNPCDPVNNRFRHRVFYGHNSLPDFSLSFHNYDFLWDKYKIEWSRDGNLILDELNFYQTRSNWSENKNKKEFRAHRVSKPSNLNISDPKNRFVVNPYFPSNSHYAGNLILGYVTRQDGNRTPYNGDGPEMKTDFIKIWVRSNCLSGLRIVSVLDWKYPTQWSGSAIETGYDIQTFSNSGSNNIKISYGRNCIFSASNEIILTDGFEAELGSFFTAWIKPCTGAWDLRETEENNFIGENELINSDNEFMMVFESTKEYTGEICIKDLGNLIEIFSEFGTIEWLRIIDMKGSEIYNSDKIFLNELSIDKNFFPQTGVYIMQIFDGNTLLNRKVSISK